MPVFFLQFQNHSNLGGHLPAPSPITRHFQSSDAFVVTGLEIDFFPEYSLDLFADILHFRSAVPKSLLLYVIQGVDLVGLLFGDGSIELHLSFQTFHLLAKRKIAARREGIVQTCCHAHDYRCVVALLVGRLIL